MQNRKPRVLFVTEATYLPSGYGTQGRELLSRLHKSGKYELCELASYGDLNHPEVSNIPWTYLPNNPLNEEEAKYFNGDQQNQFGKFKFEAACLEFRPDIVCDFRDEWYFNYQGRSPFRPYFHWAISPTVDAEPQREDWLFTFQQADRLIAYQEWSHNVLKKADPNGLLNLMGWESQGVNSEEFFPYPNKAQHKKQCGFPEDSIVIGMVSRNNIRKLYPNLFADFAALLKAVPTHIASRLLLYIHTSYPDQGWDIAKYLLDAGISHKTFFTYVCQNCRTAFPIRFQDAKTVCPACKQFSATPPHPGNGVERKMLNGIYNLMDIYVQYASCLKVGTEVLLDRGWIPIEDVVIGDKVFTHKGRWKSVSKTFAHDQGDRPLDITCCGFAEKLTITSEHPVYGLFKSKLNMPKGTYTRKWLGRKLQAGQKLPTPTFLEAEDIQEGDMLAFIINEDVNEIKKIDLAEFAKTTDVVIDSQISLKYGDTYNRFIELDTEFCRFLGLYGADGTFQNKKSSGHITVTCNSKDEENISLSKRVLKSFGKDPVTYDYNNRSAIDVTLHSKLHARFFETHCKKNKFKQLPDWVVTLPLEQQREIIRGLYMGDGCFYEKRNISIFDSTSVKLIEQLIAMLQRSRINYRHNISYKGGNRLPLHRIEIRGNAKLGQFIYGDHYGNNFYYENIRYVRVKKIEASDYIGRVYNLEVEDDNSYQTRYTCVHNSEGMGLGQAEAAAAGLPLFAPDYSAMKFCLDKTKGFRLEIASYFKDNFQCNRAIPSQKSFIEQVKKWIELPQSMKDKKSRGSREGAIKNFSWDKYAVKWMEMIDSLPLRDEKETWLSPPRVYQPPQQPPSNLSAQDLVRWGISEVMKEPRYLGTFLERQLIWRILYNQNPQLNVVETVMQEFYNYANFRNHWEGLRAQKFKL